MWLMEEAMVTPYLQIQQGEPDDVPLHYTFLSGKESNVLFILFPGIVISAYYVYTQQLPLFLAVGDVVLVDYSHSNFSAEKTFTQLTHLLQSDIVADKKIYLVGTSFGASCILRYLMQAPDSLVKKIHKVLLLGSMVSTHDFEVRFMSRFIRLAEKTNSSRVLQLLARTLRLVLRGDKKRKDNTEVRNSIKKVSNKALAQRLGFLLKKYPLKNLHHHAQLQAYFIWWKKDAVQRKRRQELENIFFSSQSATIRGIHGQLATGAENINPHIQVFLSP